MAESVLELIVQSVQDTVHAVEGVTCRRQLRSDDRALADKTVIIQQADAQVNEALSLPGNPRRVAWDQAIELAIYRRRPETTDQAADRGLNATESEVTAAVMADPQLGGLALDTALASAATIDEPEGRWALRILTLIVTYRVREDDPTTGG